MIHLKGSTYYIPGPVCTGVYIKDETCLLIDPGLDDSSAKKVLKELKSEGITPKVIINTHSHADHYGANEYIRKKEPVLVCASEKESVIIQNPQYEPFYLYSASPPKELLNKFFMGAPCQVDRILAPGKSQIFNFEIEIVSLPGHSIDQIGVITDDNIFFCGDTIISADIIDKYQLPYVYDVHQLKKSIELILRTNCDSFVLAHGGAVKDVIPHAEVNLKLINSIKEYLLTVLETPQTREEILALFVREKNIELNMVQYPLLSASISAYLTSLVQLGRVRYYFEDGKLYWCVQL